VRVSFLCPVVGSSEGKGFSPLTLCPLWLAFLLFPLQWFQLRCAWMIRSTNFVEKSQTASEEKD